MSQNNTNANANTAEGTIDSPPLTYKQQLDEAASKVKYPKPEEKGGIVNQVVEKGEEDTYIYPSHMFFQDSGSHCTVP